MFNRLSDSFQLNIRQPPTIKHIRNSAQGSRPRINKIKIATKDFPIDFFTFKKTPVLQKYNKFINKKLGDQITNLLNTPTFSNGFKEKKQKINSLIEVNDFKYDKTKKNNRLINQIHKHSHICKQNLYSAVKPIFKLNKKYQVVPIKTKRKIRIKSFCPFEEKKVILNKKGMVCNQRKKFVVRVWTSSTRK